MAEVLNDTAERLAGWIETHQGGYTFRALAVAILASPPMAEHDRQVAEAERERIIAALEHENRSVDWRETIAASAGALPGDTCDECGVPLDQPHRSICTSTPARVDAVPVLGEGWMDAAARRAFLNQVARDERKRTDARP